MAQTAVLFVLANPPWDQNRSGKPMVKIDNREVFMRSVELYANRDSVQQRILCVLPDDLAHVQQKYGAHLGFQGVSAAAGGPDWFGAVARGLEKLKPEIEIVIVHDACCPATPYTLLDALEQAVEKTGAAVPIVNLTGSLAKLGDANQIGEWTGAARMAHVQSPQIFSRKVLLDAYEKRSSIKTPLADDAALVKAAGGKITTVPGWKLSLRVDSDEAVRLAGDVLKHLPRLKSKAPISPFDEAQW
ncbi:MAG TPA: 2-C-methyl-D-erythritol 4-phosphate cytidylyltransferase [Phycisphaerae bacterium]|nr:2-C-methyl-D-erythritol 4-phosphate cytidylyltransferase [Phycisphaerae bacterium]